MTHEQLLHDKADLIYELSEARTTWMGEKAVSGFATFDPIDALLDEYHDLEIALTHEQITDYD